MTGHEEAIVVAGRREDWPGGPRRLTARTPMPMALPRLKPLLLLGLVLWCYAPTLAHDRQAEPLPSAGQAGARRNGSAERAGFAWRPSRKRLGAATARRSSTRRSSSSAAARSRGRSPTRPCRSMSSPLPTCAKATPIWPTSCACSCRPSMSTRRRTAPPSSGLRACGAWRPTIRWCSSTGSGVTAGRRSPGRAAAWPDGAQGPDISTIPAIALRGIEVLRDGAAAQYGSDAIAGVLNFLLKDDRDGGSVELSSGTHAAGDGREYAVAANTGLPLGRTGFANLSLEYGNTASTDRSVQRTDAAGPRRGRESSRRRPRPAMGSPASRRRSQAPRQPRPPVRQRRAGVRPRELRAPVCADVLLLPESQHAGRRVQQRRRPDAARRRRAGRARRRLGALPRGGDHEQRARAGCARAGLRRPALPIRSEDTDVLVTTVSFLCFTLLVAVISYVYTRCDRMTTWGRVLPGRSQPVGLGHCRLADAHQPLHRTLDRPERGRLQPHHRRHRLGRRPPRSRWSQPRSSSCPATCA